MFRAVAYDVDSREAASIFAGKFNENCYSDSEAVISMHYLLKKKPYRIRWLGNEMLIGFNLSQVTREEDLLGISVAFDKDDYVRNNPDWENQDYREKIDFIEENHSTWERLSPCEEAVNELRGQERKTVKYEGYLINHTRKEAIDLKNYFDQSKTLVWVDGEVKVLVVVDPIPVLTDEWGGSQMIFFEGVPTEATDKLAGTRVGDLFEIVEVLPEGYRVINCCFADVWGKAAYCRDTFGINEDGLILANKNGDLFKAVRPNIYGNRGASVYMKVETEENDRGIKIKYIPIPIEDGDEEMRES